MKLWLAVIGCIGLAGAAQAQAKVATVETITAGEFDKVGAILAQQQRNLAEACATVKLLKAEMLTISEPVVLGADGMATGGLWRVRYSVDACGKLALRMMEFRPVKGGIALDALVPGDSMADRKLQADVTKSFMMAGQVMMTKCVDYPVIRDTKVRAFPKTPKDRWQELWTGRMCGRDIGQLVEFMPTKSGTTFKMSLPVQTAK